MTGNSGFIQTPSKEEEVDELCHCAGHRQHQCEECANDPKCGYSEAKSQCRMRKKDGKSKTQARSSPAHFMDFLFSFPK